MGYSILNTYHPSLKKIPILYFLKTIIVCVPYKPLNIKKRGNY